MAKAIELTQANVSDASKAELLAFGNESCGFEFTGEESREYLISEICKSQDWVEKDPAEDATHVVVRLGKELGALGEFGYRGGCNGRMFTIPREIDTEIPIEFYHSIVDSHRQGFTIQPLDKFTEVSPTENRLEVSGVPMTIKRFLKKA